ncbi:LysR family transcriptional regulator [Thalassobacillus sp. CUG 92003]|uniref:LysR family transcriptional regulator n=1 Tax=Thalassobacillus sp. CUG 92003 TaxID=2736641 RepID=UPI0015E7D414|nr:LysR family transcriptional regulator [Thalassobacillus sp. CUG 92003]
MDTRLLEYFLAVSKELHYTRAAENLGISQPTLSQQIRILESRVGAKLFHQKGKKIFMTDAGKVLMERANRVFYELDQATKEIAEINELSRGRLTIGSSGNHLLHTSILSFHKLYPNIQLSIIDNTTEDTVANVLDFNYDLGVVFLPVQDDRLESRCLFTAELYIVCSRNHELASGPSIKMKELAKFRLLLLQTSYFIRRIVDHYCKESGIKIDPIIELSDLFSLLEITADNAGITILPKKYVEQMNDPRVTVIPISDPIPKKEVGIIYQKKGFMSSAGKAFIDHLLHNYQVTEEKN